MDRHTGLNLRQRHLGRRRSIGAETERLVRGIEVKLGAGSREQIVAGGFENGRHVHSGRQPGAETAGGDRDMILPGSVVEVGDGIRAVGGVQECKGIAGATLIVVSWVQRIPCGRNEPAPRNRKILGCSVRSIVDRRVVNG